MGSDNLEHGGSLMLPAKVLSWRLGRCSGPLQFPIDPAASGRAADIHGWYWWPYGWELAQDKKWKAPPTIEASSLTLSRPVAVFACHFLDSSDRHTFEVL
ncbi:hypothetical protein VTH06DRAFT_2335 [Thermothelomyces fergusii]